MAKVGILTMFYNSRNFGGCLQAYALWEYLREKGVYAEQINYCRKKKKNRIKRLIALKPSTLYEKFDRRIIRKYIIKTDKTKALSSFDLAKRDMAFERFRNDLIRNSDEIYFDETIKGANDKYDLFVVGSDQVWNEAVEGSPYLLSFVDEGKEKVSYAASISQEYLSSYAKKTFKKALGSYSAISVREREAVELLKDCTEKDIEWVADPVLLIDDVHWRKIAKKCVSDERYIFCYFLGTDTNERNAAIKYSKEKEIKIITLPFLQNKPNAVDNDFGDERLWDISPREFLSLIDGAEIIFTDSFHATVFSYIFKKEFMVFSRKEGKTNSRISSFLSAVGMENRFFDKNAEDIVSYISSQGKTEYKSSEVLEEMKKRSKEFIRENIINKVKE